MSQEVLILGLNPAWQRLFYVDKFTPGEVHRIERVEEYGSGKGINCGLVLRLLGGTPLMMHFLGSEHGSRIFDEISAYGIRRLSGSRNRRVFVRPLFLAVNRRN